MPVEIWFQVILFGAVGAIWIFFATVGWERYIGARPRIINRRWQAWAVAIISLLLMAGALYSGLRG